MTKVLVPFGMMSFLFGYLQANMNAPVALAWVVLSFITIIATAEER